MSIDTPWSNLTTNELYQLESALDAYDDLWGLRQEGRDIRDAISAELRKREDERQEPEPSLNSVNECEVLGRSILSRMDRWRNQA